MKWIISPFVGEGDRVVDKAQDRPFPTGTVVFLAVLTIIAWAFV